MSTRGVIAAGDPQTARAGAEALAAGGNATDAVCAAAFASFVVEPPLTSPAGGGLLLAGDTRAGFELWDFFARVPGLGGGRPDDLDFLEVIVDFGPTTQPFWVGRGAAAAPGMLQGLVELQARRGRLPLAQVVAPAVHLARAGWQISVQVQWVLRLLEPIVTLTPGAKAIFCDADGRLPEPGATLRNAPLADALEALGRQGLSWVQHVLHPALLDGFGPHRGGLLTRRDLQSTTPVVRQPLRVPYRGYEVLTSPPPAAGGGLVGLGLRLAEHGGVADVPFGSPEHLGRLAHALSATSAVRTGARYDARLREPGFLEQLLSDDAVAAAWSRGDDRPEHPLGGTTHVSVLDGEGGAAALTSSNGEGCGYTLPTLGIHVNNFLGEEDINPGGFHTAAPGTEMTTMMSPTVVLDGDGVPVLVLGSGGSNRIRTAVLQVLVHHLGHGLPLQQAIAADRLHVEGSRLWMERAHGAHEATEPLLAAWPDASVFDAPNMFFGGVHAAALVDGRPVGTGDPRRGGATCSPADL